jgi:hypothetical protein
MRHSEAEFSNSFPSFLQTLLKSEILTPRSFRLRRLLVVKTFMEDHDAEKISPSPIMDAMWHAATLDSRLYADLQKALGCVLHHRP